jgi:DNA-binding MarR family transcriptional regulator
MGIESDAVRSWLSVVRAYHLCESVMAQRLAAIGVRMAEHEVLANVLSRPGISQQALSARCFSAKSHISALIGQFEQRKLVRREPDPADARAKQLFLTRSGEALARRTTAIQAEVVRAMAEAIGDEAQMRLVEAVMDRTSARLQELLDEPVR